MSVSLTTPQASFSKEEAQQLEVCERRILCNITCVRDKLKDFPKKIQIQEQHSAFGMPVHWDLPCQLLVVVVKEGYSVKDPIRSKVIAAFQHATTMQKQVAEYNEEPGAPLFLTDEYIATVKKGDTQVMRLGWSEHDITVTFFNDYMVIANGGSRPYTLTAFKIEPQLVTKKLLLAMVAMRYRPQKESVKFFYTELPQRLDATQDATTKAIEEMSPKIQKWDNCSVYSLKCAFRVVLFAIKYQEAVNALQAGKAPAEVNTKQVVAQAKSFSTEWRALTLITYLKTNGMKIKYPTSEQEIPQLLEAVKEEIQRKAKKPALEGKMPINNEIVLATIDKITRRVTKPIRRQPPRAREIILLTGAMGVFLLPSVLIQKKLK